VIYLHGRFQLRVEARSYHTRCPKGLKSIDSISQVNLLAAFARGEGAVDVGLDVFSHPLDHSLAPELSEQPLDLVPRALAIRIDRIHAAANLPVSAPRKSQSINQWNTGCRIFGPRREARTGAEEYMAVASFHQWYMHQRAEHCVHSLQHAHQPTDRAARDAGLDGAGEVVHERNLGRRLVVRL
jgi:hypothetical protein